MSVVFRMKTFPQLKSAHTHTHTLNMKYTLDLNLHLPELRLRCIVFKGFTGPVITQTHRHPSYGRVFLSLADVSVDPHICARLRLESSADSAQ